MSVRRVGDGKLELPPNPVWIDFEESDGDSSTWPTNTTMIVDHEGQVNYMQLQDLTSYSAIRWRTGVAKAIAVATNMAEGPNYVLRQWPAGYQMYDHHKGTVDNPRHDIYLFGSPNKRFRSVNEFIPHAIWLYSDYQKTNTPCQCKYCTKKTQKEITSTLEVFRSTPLSSSPGSSASRPRVVRDKNAKADGALHSNRERQREQKVYAVIQSALKPLPQPYTLTPSPHIMKQPMLAERNADLRAVTARTSMPLKRWFREGEVVFCAINPPIVGPTPEAVINVWPGIVKETKIKSIPVPRDGTTLIDVGTTTTASTAIKNDTPSGVVLENDSSNEPSWSVRQYNMYTIQLLAVSHSLVLPDDQVIPHQAYVMPAELLQVLEAQVHHLDREKMKEFNPCPGSSTSVNFSDAASPFVVAMQIAAELTKFFSLLDDYESKYIIPSPPRPNIPPPQSIPPPQAPTSLQSAIEAAGRHNAQTGMMFTNRAIDADLPQLPDHRIQTQTEYQGLWWGPERIWAGDFVRLKVPRLHIAPGGSSPGVYPPAGPGTGRIEHIAAEGDEALKKHDAGSRGVFMQVDAFYLEETTDSSGHIQKEVRARGMIYELADEDWQDPEEDARMQSSSTPTDSAQPTPSTVTTRPSSAFLSGPSPLKPPPLPNPDPTVPVASTSSSVLSQPPPPAIQKPSGPSYYLLPEAPRGYRFRQICYDNWEAQVSLSLICGRYYPRILDHPMLSRAVQEARAHPSPFRGNHLWAMEGIAAGHLNSVDAEYYRQSRVRMMDDADKNAMAKLEEFIRKAPQREDSVMEDADDVDELAQKPSMEVDG